MKNAMCRLASPWVVVLTMAAGGLVGGCGDDEKGGDGTPEECVPEFASGPGAIGDACMQLDDCASGFCAVSSHAPTTPGATCMAAPASGDVHVMANVKDLMTDELMPNVTIKIGGALDINQNPTGFPVTATMTSDATGYVDTVLTGETVKLGLGIMAVIEAPDYYTTVTGLVKPEVGCGMYPAAVRNPDLKMMKAADLTYLSDLLLAADPALADQLPLGDKGGVVGLIRDVVTGEKVVGAEMRSTRDTSVAKLYYLNETKDAFTTGSSSASGLFVIIDAGLAEEFDAYLNDQLVSRVPATIGETVGVLMTTTVQVQL